MNLYGHDHSFLGLSFSDLFAETVARNSPDLMLDPEPSTSSAGRTANDVRSSSPPRHRHDGSSPLPLGMDWCPAPRRLDGRGYVWPHDPRTGWSYCITVPSYSILPSSRGSAPIVFYRVQVGVQSPQAITTIHGVLRRFSDFAKLFSELKKAFPEKYLPPTPPRKLLQNKSRIFLDERRCALEDWLEKLLSDIDLSRSAVVANFLELEVAASLDISLHAGSTVASEYGDDTYDVSETGTPRHEINSFSALSRGKSVPENNVTGTLETMNTNFSKNSMRQLLDTIQKLSRDQMLSRGGDSTRGKDKAYEGTSTAVGCDEDSKDVISAVESNKVATHVRRLSTESAGSDSSSKATETSTLGGTSMNVDSSFNIHEGSESPRALDINSTILLPSYLIVALPLEARRKFNRVLSTMEQRLATAKTDMEDLVARLNQELALRQYLSTKVKDLEVELETTKDNIKENLQQAISSEKERFNQMQWDIEELRKSCLELELKLKLEQDEKVLIESSKTSMIGENEMLLQELDAAREQFDNLQKHHEQSELKSKTDVKVLVKEVKSLRTSQSELKQELSRLIKEKLDIERILQKEKQRVKQVSSTNSKLLHECEILRSRLQECSVNFLVEEEDKLIMDASTPSDAIDLLVTSDNRIGLLLAEAQLLAQDVENARIAELSSSGDKTGNTDDELRKMVTDIFIDNARLRKQMISVIRCALSAQEKPENEVKEDDGAFRITALSNF
ncbi:hypothetical protein V2J09_011137 [Rumex salicifolius]